MTDTRTTASLKARAEALSFPAKLFIDGKSVDAASGKSFDCINPGTGQVIAQIAEGDAEDINRAVAAARRAFDKEIGRAHV